MPDINHFLLLVVGFSCVLLLVRFAGLSGGKKLNRWVWTSLVILAVMGTTYLLQPNVAGYVGAVFWILFVLIPGVTSRYLQYLLGKQSYTQAVRITRVLGILQPSDDWRGLPEIVNAFALIQSGDMAAAEETVSRHQDWDQLLDRVLHSFYLTSTGRFDDYLQWIEENFLHENFNQYPELFPRYFQALGETGRHREMAEAFILYKETLSSPPLRRHFMLCRLYLFAFNGRVQEVQNLFLGPLRTMAVELKSIWLATAFMAAGETDEALLRLGTLKDSPSLPNRIICERRIKFGLAASHEDERAEFKDLLDGEGRQVAHLLRFGYPISFTRHKRGATATYGILAIMSAVFCLEVVLGGSTDTLNLIRMGAMIKTPFAALEWWRAITSLFLHFGFYHFLLNGLALFIIAPYVEKWLGKGRLILIFLVSGVVANFMDVALSSRPYIVLVGASGAVMAILGASTHRLLMGARREKSQTARSSLRLIFFILAIQVVLDLFTPRVSLRAHLLGFSIGIILSMITDWGKGKKRD